VRVHVACLGDKDGRRGGGAEREEGQGGGRDRERGADLACVARTMGEGRRVGFSEDEASGEDVSVAVARLSVGTNEGTESSTGGSEEGGGEGEGGEGEGATRRHATWSVDEGERIRFEQTRADEVQPKFKVVPEWDAGRGRPAAASTAGDGGDGSECLHCKGTRGLPARKLCTECMSAWFCCAECIAEGRDDHRAGCEAVQARNKALEAIIASVDAMEFPDLPAHLLPAATKKCVHFTQSPRPSPCGLCGREKATPALLKCGHEFCSRCLDEYQADRLFRGVESNGCPHTECTPSSKANKRKQTPGPELWHMTAEELLRMASPSSLAKERRELLLAQAESLWCKTIEADPILIDQKWTPRAYLGLAAVAKLRGDLEAEGALLRQVVHLVPGDPLVASNLALWLNRSGGDFWAATRVLEEADRECQPSSHKELPNKRSKAGIGVSCASSLNVAPVFHIAAVDSMLRRAAWEDEQEGGDAVEEECIGKRYSDMQEHLRAALKHGRGVRAVERFVLPVLSTIAQECENWEEALTWLNRMEVDYEVLVQLSTVNMELERYEASKRYALQAIRLRNGVSEPFVLLAKSSVGLGDLNGSIAAMRAALAIEPLDIDYLLYVVMLLRTRKLEDMREHGADVQEQKRRSISSSLEASQSEEQLQALAFLERHSEMEEALGNETEAELLERIASDPVYSECDFSLRCALAVDSTRAEVHRDLGALLYQLGGKAAGDIGLQSFRRALEFATPDQYEEWREDLQGMASLEREGLLVEDPRDERPYWYGKKRRWMFASNGDGLEYAEIDETGQRKDHPKKLSRKSSVVRRMGRKWARRSQEFASGVVTTVGGIMNALAQARSAGLKLG